MKLEDIHALRFDTLEQAEDTLSSQPHKYYYVCSGCGNEFTCRCSQKHEKVIVGSCPHCKPEGGSDGMNKAGFAPADGMIPNDMGNRLPTGGRSGNPKTDKFQGYKTPPMY